jgi:hypothetical protein
VLNNFDRIKKVNDLLKNTEKQSLTDILESFSCITKDYNEIGNKIEQNKYSNVLYSKCTEDEKKDFFELDAEEQAAAKNPVKVEF